MGHHAGAIVAYGYDLGDGDDEGWNIREPFDSLPWFRDSGHDDFGSALMERLEAHDVCGVKMELYGYEWGAVFLAGPVVAEYNGCGSLSFDASLMGLAGREWDDVLKSAVAALGITPKTEPGWHLLVRYG
jgi:hypothetical protein